LIVYIKQSYQFLPLTYLIHAACTHLVYQLNQQNFDQSICLVYSFVSSSQNKSFNVTFNAFAICIHKFNEGLYLLFSTILIVCRETPDERAKERLDIFCWIL